MGVRYKDLSIWLKIIVIYGFISLFIDLMIFGAGFWVGIMEALA